MFFKPRTKSIEDRIKENVRVLSNVFNKQNHKNFKEIDQTRIRYNKLFTDKETKLIDEFINILKDIESNNNVEVNFLKLQSIINNEQYTPILQQFNSIHFDYSAIYRSYDENGYNAAMALNNLRELFGQQIERARKEQEEKDRPTLNQLVEQYKKSLAIQGINNAANLPDIDEKAEIARRGLDNYINGLVAQNPELGIGVGQRNRDKLKGLLEEVIVGASEAKIEKIQKEAAEQRRIEEERLRVAAEFEKKRQADLVAAIGNFNGDVAGAVKALGAAVSQDQVDQIVRDNEGLAERLQSLKTTYPREEATLIATMQGFTDASAAARARIGEAEIAAFNGDVAGAVKALGAAVSQDQVDQIVRDNEGLAERLQSLKTTYPREEATLIATMQGFTDASAAARARIGEAEIAAFNGDVAGAVKALGAAVSQDQVDQIVRDNEGLAERLQSLKTTYPREEATLIATMQGFTDASAAARARIGEAEIAAFNGDVAGAVKALGAAVSQDQVDQIVRDNEGLAERLQSLKTTYPREEATLIATMQGFTDASAAARARIGEAEIAAFNGDVAGAVKALGAAVSQDQVDQIVRDNEGLAERLQSLKTTYPREEATLIATMQGFTDASAAARARIGEAEIAAFNGDVAGAVKALGAAVSQDQVDQIVRDNEGLAERLQSLKTTYPREEATLIATMQGFTDASAAARARIGEAEIAAFNGDVAGAVKALGAAVSQDQVDQIVRDNEGLAERLQSLKTTYPREEATLIATMQGFTDASAAARARIGEAEIAAFNGDVAGAVKALGAAVSQDQVDQIVRDNEGLAERLQSLKTTYPREEATLIATMQGFTDASAAARARIGEAEIAAFNGDVAGAVKALGAAVSQDQVDQIVRDNEGLAERLQSLKTTYPREEATLIATMQGFTDASAAARARIGEAEIAAFNGDVAGAVKALGAAVSQDQVDQIVRDNEGLAERLQSLKTTYPREEATLIATMQGFTDASAAARARIGEAEIAAFNEDVAEAVKALGAAVSQDQVDQIVRDNEGLAERLQSLKTTYPREEATLIATMQGFTDASAAARARIGEAEIAAFNGDVAGAVKALGAAVSQDQVDQIVRDNEGLAERLQSLKTTYPREEATLIATMQGFTDASAAARARIGEAEIAAFNGDVAEAVKALGAAVSQDQVDQIVRDNEGLAERLQSLKTTYPREEATLTATMQGFTDASAAARARIGEAEIAAFNGDVAEAVKALGAAVSQDQVDQIVRDNDRLAERLNGLKAAYPAEEAALTATAQGFTDAIAAARARIGKAEIAEFNGDVAKAVEALGVAVSQDQVDEIVRDNDRLAERLNGLKAAYPAEEAALTATVQGFTDAEEVARARIGVEERIVVLSDKLELSIAEKLSLKNGGDASATRQLEELRLLKQQLSNMKEQLRQFKVNGTVTVGILEEMQQELLAMELRIEQLTETPAAAFDIEASDDSPEKGELELPGDDEYGAIDKIAKGLLSGDIVDDPHDVSVAKFNQEKVNYKLENAGLPSKDIRFAANSKRIEILQADPREYAVQIMQGVAETNRDQKCQAVALGATVFTDEALINTLELFNKKLLDISDDDTFAAQACSVKINYRDYEGNPAKTIVKEIVDIHNQIHALLIRNGDNPLDPSKVSEARAKIQALQSTIQGKRAVLEEIDSRAKSKGDPLVKPVVNPPKTPSFGPAAGR